MICKKAYITTLDFCNNLFHPIRKVFQIPLHMLRYDLLFIYIGASELNEQIAKSVVSLKIRINISYEVNTKGGI